MMMAGGFCVSQRNGGEGPLDANVDRKLISVNGVEEIHNLTPSVNNVSTYSHFRSMAGII